MAKGLLINQGPHKAHGSPLGEEEVKLTKAALGLPAEDFYISQSVIDFFKNKLPLDAKLEQDWQQKFDAWRKSNPERYRDFQTMLENKIPPDLEQKLQAIEIKSPVAGRKASQDVLNVLGDLLPQLYGGSADLSGSDLTMMKKFPIVEPGTFAGRNIKYGIREFGMACIATGLNKTQMIVPFYEGLSLLFQTT